MITAEDAKARRQALTTEMEFYGAMDGAGKFVRGDAVAALIITGINIVGGLIMAMVYGNQTLAQAFETHTIPTIGDGLSRRSRRCWCRPRRASRDEGRLRTGARSEMGDQMFASGRSMRLSRAPG